MVEKKHIIYLVRAAYKKRLVFAPIFSKGREGAFI